MAVQYLKKAYKYSKLIQYLPFVRAILLNGSVAIGEAKTSSDIDLLIITRQRRLWTCRFFVLTFLTLLGQKRPKYGENHAGKFCVNYFMAENHLIIPHDRSENMNKYCAENYGASILIAGDQAVFNNFVETNSSWWQQYGISHSTSKPLPKNSKSLFLFIKSMIEKLLTNNLGDILEQRFNAHQIKNIEKDPRTKKHSDLIVYNDDEARFHPPKHESSNS